MTDLVGDDLVHELLDAAADRAPGANAVRDAAGRWTYGELRDHSRRAAQWLREQGVRRGDRVVAQLPSCREAVALFFGACRLGAAFVPLNVATTPFQLSSIVANAEPALVLAEADLPLVWKEIEDAVAAEAVPVELDDVAVLIYTSGSTSTPKGVVCPHRQVRFAVRALTEVLGYRADDVVFCRFPLSWDVGLYKVLMSCAAGSEVVLAEGESDLVLLKRMRETGATVVPIVPSLANMIIALARRARDELPPVRLFSNTGAALPQPAIDELRAYFPGARVVRQYGQTEAKRMTVMPVHEDRERPGAVGLPLPGTSILIVDQDGAALPAGRVGEIVAVGPHVMAGYWRAPEVTARTYRFHEPTGVMRLHTGDYGRLDEDGYLYFEGRRDDMFKRRGIRMSTLEVEAAALDVPGVRAACALAPTDRHDLALFVESGLTTAQIVDELMVRLDPARMPAVCRVLDRFPVTSNGKNARDVLASMLTEGR
ncbi:class I adenylate-forming enzyme family protein [Lentzea aerocolonigenes]|uniref:class I adenylate-forming enzyme family protein n=1 Tax=Lentzea aerocolonigenes TaxID=68170 RepID=UPI0004C32D92|nr:AMP-binding protein [Lentzea aerocolonigenes]MCP2243434.1 Acyl-CoA synthetase (AMP-forming)/AMP-acid ligase II [Lentzea aerocolonigenes]